MYTQEMSQKLSVYRLYIYIYIFKDLAFSKVEILMIARRYNEKNVNSNLYVFILIHFIFHNFHFILVTILFAYIAILFVYISVLKASNQ